MTSRAATQPSILRVPAWEHHTWLRAGFSMRSGGVSSAYGPDEQNLGWTKEDDPDHVALNRARFVGALSGQAGMDLLTVGQIHGAVVRDMDAEAGPLMSAKGRAMLEGDGLTSATPGKVLAILTADCVPVLLADTQSHAVGALHAGWRGTLAHIGLTGVAAMRERYASHPDHLIAAIGPCIGACCFEVGAEVRDAFVQDAPEAATFFSLRGTSLHMDLVEANRRQLLQAGLSADNISVLGLCTACARDAYGARQFFSYRAEAGKTGRMLSGIVALR